MSYQWNLSVHWRCYKINWLCAKHRFDDCLEFFRRHLRFGFQMSLHSSFIFYCEICSLKLYGFGYNTSTFIELIFVYSRLLKNIFCFHSKTKLAMENFSSESTKGLHELVLLFETWFKQCIMGNGCGSVDSAFAFNTREPRFKPSHRQLLLNNYLLLTVRSKDKIKVKEAGNGSL